MSTAAAGVDLASIVHRVSKLEGELKEKEERLAAVETENEELREENADLHDRVDELESQLDRVEKTSEAALNKGGTNLERITELQGRELEKGAHLLEDNIPLGDVADYDVDVADGRLEKIQKEDGEVYLRVPESDDPLNRGGSTTLSHGDLLPIQQLAQMDDDMLHSSTSDLPSRLAAKLWKARVDETVGDNPWQRGSKGVREYVKASDMKHWIRRQEDGVSDEYAKKLVSRTIDRLMDFSNNRLAIKKQSERKNGLSYKERRVLLMEDAEIPGETTGSESQDNSPETTGVVG